MIDIIDIIVKNMSNNDDIEFGNRFIILRRGKCGRCRIKD